MASFKQVQQTFLLKRLFGFWGNVIKNYRGDVKDDDFFDIIRNCFDHDRAVTLIEDAYTRNEIEKMSNARYRSNRLDMSDSLDDVFQVLWNYEETRDKCKAVLSAIQEYVLADCETDADEIFARRFSEMAGALKLSALEIDVLLLAYIKDQTCFDWPRRIEDRDKPLYYAMALDRSYPEILGVMNANGKLRKFNLLDNDWDFNGRTLGGYLDGVDSDPIERRFYKPADVKNALPWNFYGALAEQDGEVLKKMLSSCSGRCNILLYGAPGTGKTSFAMSLAKEIGKTPYLVKQGDDDGKNMKSEARMIGIEICNEHESPDASLMVVDEADELLRGSTRGFSFFGPDMGGKSTEKGVMNTILDGMKIPAIWISNAPAAVMDESVRRRFDYSVCFEELNNSQRVSIWKNVVSRLKLGRLISEVQINDYASKYATSAGGISLVLENVKRMQPEKKEVDALVATLMKPHCKLMEVKEENRFLPAKGYSLDGLNIKGKVKLDKIIKSVRNYMSKSFNETSEDRPRMNILMFGPPGTGKTEFVKYLGKELDRKVMVMKGSDILSKWVGEAEQNIAQAFHRAEAERAILFFDEIDGLVQPRESASASWEISQVNELLQQMENFDGVMIAATNFCRNLDPAIMRRFTFKLEFDYLDDEGKKLFFERMFKTSLTDAEFGDLKSIRNLAPGDFRTVRQELFYMDEDQSNRDRIAALKDECLLKKDGDRKTRIGFDV